jgi:signal transduction histidine kinase
LLLALAWARTLTAGWLPAAAAAGAAAALLLVWSGSRGNGVPLLRLALVALAGVLVTGALAERRFGLVAYDWPQLVAQREAALAVALERRMADAEARGREAADRAARAAAEASDADRFGRLAEVQAALRVDAVFVLGEAGNLVAWAGDHRGAIPDEVRDRPVPVHFAERPLFSYLYFSTPVAGSAEQAVAAVLVETGVVPRAEEEALTALTLAARTRVPASFRSGPGRTDDVAWSLVERGDTVVHARIARVTQADLRADVERWGQRVAVGLAFLGFALAAVGWLRSVGPRPPLRLAALPLLVAALLLVVAPLDRALGLQRLFEPGLFVLPLPGDAKLGALLAALLPIAALVATLRPPVLEGHAYRLALAAGAVTVGLAYPATIRLLIDGAAVTLLRGGSVLWLGLQVLGLLVLSILTALALPRLPHVAATRRRAGGPVVLVAMGLTVAAVLAAVVVLRGDPWAVRRPLAAALWCIPFVLCALAFTRYRGRGGILLRWLTAGALSSTAVLPFLWLASMQARLEHAAEEIDTLGAEVAPIVEYKLMSFGLDAIRRAADGEDGLQLLYRSWVASGLAREPYGARVTLWSAADEPLVELALGGAEGSDAASVALREHVRQARDQVGPRVGGMSGEPSINKVMAVVLPDARAVSVTIPPRRSFERTSVAAPFLGIAADPDVRLTLVETRGRDVPPTEVEWRPAANGWRTDVAVRYPDGIYHARVEVGVMSLGMRLARGALLFAIDLGLLALLWAGGSAARGLAPLPAGMVATLLGSFRARVTVALFAFFLVPTALFGWVAYGAFAREVERTARTVAARAARQAVLEFPDSDGDLRMLAARAGGDVLYYYNSGELAQVSSPEALGLGVYSAWMSPAVFRSLRAGDATEAQEVRELESQSYLVAYHALRPAGILAVPTSLSAGDTAVRQRELAHLILFAALVGALLSLTLSLAVGRALAGPIGRLRRAAAAVGAGNLGVRLPEPQGDEFGELYASFNRMTRRLRRARIRERRTARVLAWGEVARQVAHEIKNPLTPIKLSIQHIRRAYRDGRPDFGSVLERNVDQILIEIDRLSEIARVFSRYGAPADTAGALEPVDVAGVVREALTLYRAGDTGVRYGEDIEDGLPAASARADELKEVLFNLVENARDALDGGGSVVVRARRGDGRILLEVEDDGPGISETLLPRIFEPHFSTRSTGTGLGLAIVRRLVESWGGRVTADSRPGAGTMVRVEMPLAEPREAA